MRYSLIAVALAFCQFGIAQITDYAGPGIATTGTDAIGKRSGQDLDFRYYVGAHGIYDNGLVPLQVDPSTGKITDLGSLPGAEGSVGAYGSHSWHRIKLGLDYTGSYRRYEKATTYNGLTQQAVLGVKYQYSRKIVLDMQGSAGTLNQANTVLSANSAVVGGVVDQNTLLFDNRSTYYQTGMDMNYIASSRTYYTIGGTGYIVRRKSLSLVGVNGYTLRGGVNHRTSQTITVGVQFEHKHYDYPRAFGETDINSFTASISKQIGRYWKASVAGGIYEIETQGTENVAVDPAIAALLGTTVTVRTFYKKDWLPTVTATLDRQFRHANFTALYTRAVTPGNGLYLTSQQETYGASISYTGVRKTAFSIGANRSTLATVAQNLPPYHTAAAFTSATYSFTKEFQVVASFQVRHQEVLQGGIRRNSSSVSLGFTYSPGDVPISFH